MLYVDFLKFYTVFNKTEKTGKNKKQNIFPPSKIDSCIHINKSG